MATNLQVNANTQQAVGAFNALAASIANARGQFNNLNAATNNGASGNNRYAGSITNINSAYSNLISMSKGLFNVLSAVGTGIQLVFNSLLKELDKIQGFNAIMSVTTKSSEAVAGSFQFVRNVAMRLGVDFNGLAVNYAKLTAALPEGTNRLQIAEKVFLGLSMAARTLHATNADTQLMFYAITQMASKGVVSMEELRRQLGEKLPGAIQLAAKAVNTTPELLEKAIRKGIVSAEKFLPLFGDVLIRTFSDSAEVASSSVSAALTRLTNVWVDFVKEVLDSGAGNAIVGLFDALREKLSDPYLISRFADLIKYLATKFTEFVDGLTQDDIRNGFDSFTRGIELVITVMDKLIRLLQWVINNAPLAGAIIGGIGGAAVGMVAGPKGAAIGAVAGAAGGYYVGTQLAPSKSQLDQRTTSDAAGQLAKANKSKEQELLKFTQLIPLLQQFKSLNSLKDVEGLMKAENLNTKTIADLNTILNSKAYKTDADRANAVKDYAKFGTIMGSASATLNDVLTTGGGKGKGRGNAEANSLQATLNRANGLDSNFTKEFANLTKLYKTGKLDLEQYQNAAEKLISKQPYMEQAVRAEAAAQTESNRQLNTAIDLALKQVSVKEKIAGQLEDDLKFAGMRAEELRTEQILTGYINQYADVGITLTKEQNQALRDKIILIQRTNELTAAEDQLLNLTVDKYKQQVLQLQAMDKLMADPTSGFTKKDATAVVVGQNPELFQGSDESIEIKKQSMLDMYAFIDGLRAKDLISEDAANMAKARSQLAYDQVVLEQKTGFFGALTSLTKSSSSKLQAVGKAAAIAQATVDGYVAIQKALASSAPPFNYIAAAAVGISTAANIQAIYSAQPGYFGGGYTGDAARGTVAGVTHGQEFVVNASATSRNRQLLENINRGGGATGGGGIIVEYHNYGTPQSIQVEELTPERVRIIARDEASDVLTREGPKIISADIRTPNSRTAKALNDSLNASRRRP